MPKKKSSYAKHKLKMKGPTGLGPIEWAADAARAVRKAALSGAGKRRKKVGIAKAASRKGRKK